MFTIISQPRKAHHIHQNNNNRTEITNSGEDAAKRDTLGGKVNPQCSHYGE